MTKGSKAMVKANFKYVRESAPGYFYTRKKGYDPIRVQYIDADGEKVFPTLDQPEEFARAHKYTLALLDTPAPGKSEALPGSFAALVEEHKGSPEYRTKKPKTKKSYIASLNRIVKYWGHLSVEGLKRVNILRRRDALSDTPRTADQFVTMTSTLINFGMDRGYRESNPAQRVKKINIPTPYEPWPAEAIDRIIADGNARVADAVMVLLYTGQRESDAVKMRRGEDATRRHQEWQNPRRSREDRKVPLGTATPAIASAYPIPKSIRARPHTGQSSRPAMDRRRPTWRNSIGTRAPGLARPHASWSSEERGDRLA